MVVRSFMKHRLIHPHLPRLIALVCLTLTMVGWFLTSRSVELYNQTRFRRMSGEVQSNIVVRMETYINALTQTRNMISVSPYLSRRSFSQYVKGLNFGEQYPGIQGIGYVEKIRDIYLGSHVAQARSEGLPFYKVWPVSKKKHYYAMTYLEPMDSLNRSMLGFDLSSVDELASSMKQAGSSNAPVSTQLVKLLSGSGLVIFVPLYKNSSPIKTEAQRERNLVGFLASTFTAENLFKGIFRNREEKDQRVGFSVHVGDDLLYQSHAVPEKLNLARKYKLLVAGEIWMLNVFALPSFQERSYSWIPWASLALGFLITLVLYVSLRTYWKFSLENASLYQKAQEAIQVRDEFMSIASHELKTPITTLRLQLDLISRRLKQTNDETNLKKLQDGASGASKQVSRLISLIENLLDSTRVTAGKLVLNKEDVDVTDLSRDVVERVHLQAKEVGSEIITDIEENLAGLYDRLRLEQIMLNLLTNAIKYGDGQIIRFSVKALGETLKIQVADKGVGIGRDELARVFNRYERIENKSNAPGLGLGLYILKQIVEAHGGKVEVESVLGEGSTFTVTLPLNVLHPKLEMNASEVTDLPFQ